MKQSRLALVVLSLGLGAVGCYRTIYANLLPPGTVAPTEPSDVARTAPEAWQSFFIYGLAPGERVIDAAEACLGTEHIQSIETRRTFLQGLVAAVAGFYINIYSPWNGAVHCDHDRQR